MISAFARRAGDHTEGVARIGVAARRSPTGRTCSITRVGDRGFEPYLISGPAARSEDSGIRRQARLFDHSHTPGELPEVHVTVGQQRSSTLAGSTRPLQTEFCAQWPTKPSMVPSARIAFIARRAAGPAPRRAHEWCPRASCAARSPMDTTPSSSLDRWWPGPAWPPAPATQVNGLPAPNPERRQRRPSPRSPPRRRGPYRGRLTDALGADRVMRRRGLCARLLGVAPRAVGIR